MILKLLKRLTFVTAVLIGIVILSIALTILALNSGSIQKFARNMLDEAIPGSITWDELKVSLLEGTIEIRGALLAGTDKKPIVRWERLFAEISLTSALRGSIEIRDAELDKPAVFLGIDGNGRLNILNALGIPFKRKEAPGRSRHPLPGFLAVDTCRIRNGRFGFTQKSAGWEIEISDIDSTASLDFGRETGSLALRAGGGFFALKKSRTEIMNLTAEGSIVNGIADRLAVEARTTGSDIRMRGRIREMFSNPNFDIASTLHLSLAELHDILNLGRPMSGIVTGEFSARGEVNNPTLAFNGRYGGGIIYGSRIDGIVAAVRLDDRMLSVSTLRAVSGQGYCELKGGFNMSDALANGFIMPGWNPDAVSYDMTARARQFSLRSIPGIKADAQGSMDSDVSISGKGLAPGSATAALRISTSIPNFSYGNESAPAGLSVNADAGIDAGIINIKKCRAVFGSARFQAEGYCDIKTNSIHGTFTAASPNISYELASLDLKGFFGSMAVNGSASGTLYRPVVSIGVSGDHLVFRDLTIGSIKMNASLDSTGMVSINPLTLINNESSIILSAGARLFENGVTSIAEDPSIEMKIEKFVLYPGDFKGAYTGRIMLSGNLSGTRKRPEGAIALEASGLDVGYQKIHSLNLQTNLDGGRIKINALAISLSPGEAIRCGGWIGMDRSYDLSIQTDPISFTNIIMLDTSGGLTGRLAVDIAGRGTLNNPSFSGTAVATDLALKDTRYSNASLTLQLKNYRASVKGRLNFDVDGFYNIRDRNFMVSLLFNETDLTPYFSSLGRKNLKGTISGTVKASGNAAYLDRVDLTVAVSRLDIFRNETRLIRSDSFNASLVKENIMIPGINMSILDAGGLRIEGSGNLAAGININLDAKVPLEVANRLSENATNFSGEVALSALLTGTRSQPQLHARMLFEKAGLTIPSIAGDIHGLTGTIDIVPGAVRLDDIRGCISDGRFSVKGMIGLRGLRPVSARLDAIAKGIPMNIPNVLNTTIDAGVTVSGTSDASLIKGNFVILNGLYYQDLVLNPLADAGSKPAAAAGVAGRKSIHTFLNNMHLDIAVTNKAPFEVENNLASLKINSALKITGTASNPILIGNAQVAEGKIFYLGREFVINKGKIDFTNPYRIEPYIDISSSAAIQKWTVSIGVTGTPETLKYQLSSSPVLDNNDILSLVLLGKTTGGGSTYSAAQILTSLIAFNYGGTIKKKTGIDILEVTDVTSKGKSSKGERVTVGKNITERLTYKYSIEKDGKDFKSSSIVEYKLFDAFLMDLIYDTAGKVGAEMQYNKEFR